MPPLGTATALRLLSMNSAYSPSSELVGTARKPAAASRSFLTSSASISAKIGPAVASSSDSSINTAFWGPVSAEGCIPPPGLLRFTCRALRRRRGRQGGRLLGEPGLEDYGGRGGILRG